MVPLTTLGYLEEKEVPVEIVPQTDGRFKWITTRNLQFIPKERLQRSSHYTVKIKPELVSMDGLEVKGQERKFITRPLRYLNLSSGETVYNQPISIYFNQPVDLERTKKEIILRNTATQEEIDFIVQYAGGKSEKIREEIWGFEGMKNFLASIGSNLFAQISQKETEKNNEEKVNTSIIQIYPAQDKFGREKLWDFKNNYSLIINKAYPTEGDIILDEVRTTYIYVTDVIKDITAESERTKWAAPDFFDPQGKLWVSFYEEINLDKSKITVQKLKDIGYGEKCQDEEQTISKNIECEKIPDKKRIYLTFRSKEISLGERLEINFERVLNIEGLKINPEPIRKYIDTYPKFEVLRTRPSENSTGAKLTEFIFCTNSPILQLEKEDFEKHIKSNLPFEMNYWGSSIRVRLSASYNSPCRVGEFYTEISYGLMPLSDYKLDFELEDVFVQKLTYPLQFTTGEMPGEYLNFYHLQRNYNVTSPEKTRLTFVAQNMEYVNLEICKLNPLNFLYYLEGKPKYYESYISNCQEIVRDKIELPERYWLKNYFQVDVGDYFEEPLGHYILTFSHPDYTAKRWEEGQYVYRQVFERSYLTVTNLSVVEKKINPQTASYGIEKTLGASELENLKNLYWVTDLETLNPVAGAEIKLYRQTQTKPLQLDFANSFTTDFQGIALADVLYNLRGVIIAKGKDSTVIPSGESKIDWASSAYLAQKIYLYTDKPIYRPSQEVFLKGIFRIGYDGDYEIYQDRKINLKVFNSKNDEILSKDLEISDFGTFDTSLILDKDTPLGTYRVCAERYSCIYFDVQEYVPAAFEVNLTADKEEYISKDTVHLKVASNYYFGVPLEGGEVEYTISSQNYYFDRYSDGYFNFGQRWYYWPPYNYGEKFLLRGKTFLDEKGKAEISQELDFEKLFKEKEERKSKIIVVNLTVKNSQGQSVSGQKSFIVHAGEFYLGLNADSYFLSKDQEFNFRVKSVDLQGQEIRTRNISLDIYKRDWIYSKRQEADGGYSYNWEEKRELVQTFKFDTDSNGNYAQKLKIGKEGSYIAEASARDQRENLVSSSYSFYVTGPGQVSVKPTKDTELEIEAEKTELKVGEEGKIIIKSPYSRAKALICLERGKIFEYQIRDIQQNLYQYNFTAKSEYIPNVFVSVTLLSPTPEVKFGKVEFKINTEEKELDIEVSSNKRYYLPGERVSLDITARDWRDRPVLTELSVAVVDLSILALKGNPKKNPLIFFYGGFPLTVQTSSNLKNILVETEIPTKGGGGMADEAVELARKKRGIFKETAFWQAVIRTDDFGKAKIEFTLPDNLTTWQTETLGITKDTKIGVNYQEFTTRKELMVVPLKPRFVVPGDTFYIGGKIFNQSGDTQGIDLQFSSQTLELLEKKAKKEITLKPDETQTLYFQVAAPSSFETGEHRFILSAKTDGLEDTVEQTIAITKNDTYETTATCNYTSEEAVREYVFLPDNVVKNKGELSIKSSATLAVFLSDALNYLLGYPYGCSEQIASRLNAIAVVKKGLNLPNLGDKLKLEKIQYQGKEYTIDEVVEIGLSKLYNLQKSDGGFSYWEYGESNFYLTLHVTDTLNNLSQAGYEINQNSLQRAADYLYQKITTDYRLYQNKNTVILTAYTLFNLPNFTKDEALREKIISIANDNLFINEQISNSSLPYLAILLTKGNFAEYFKNKVFQVLENRIDIDSRGAFLETNKNFLWYYYETPIKNTALLLKALSADERDIKVLDKVVRWILNSKKKDGAWGSTNNTVTVIDAFSDFLEWRRETESDFTLALEINNRKEGEYRFYEETILDQFRKEVPLRDLKFNQLNTVDFLKENHNDLPNNLYYDMSLKYFLPAEQIPPRDEGFSITREFYNVDDEENKNPLKEAKVGDVLRAHLEITVPAVRNFAMVEDYIPAGFEIVNLELETEQKSLLLKERDDPQYDYYYWRYNDRTLRPDFKELHDDRAFLFKENLSPGVYEFDYYVRALTKGKFTHLPAVVSEMYFPENFGRTPGGYFEIK
ncbi:MAG: hypothetical protein COZ89_00405 [Candidatus Nealsonbacteria bacterium CG_4_8_14_3_um_filter_37_23]|nr:MAG: hypothetical protein COZ89_00405 [Candidatus Nealsonbacteria bacterium CG_4_8_14_3_um_filter_37_23]